MLDVATPRNRAISAAGRPDSSLPRQAIVPRTSLTTLLRLPLCSSSGLIPAFLHSSPMIFSSVSCHSGESQLTQIALFGFLKDGMDKNIAPQYSLIRQL
jgi:hypothetical protein